MHRHPLLEPHRRTVADALRQASQADDIRRLLADLPETLSKAVEAALPEGESLTRAQVKEAARSGAEHAVQKVLGGIEKSREQAPA